MPGKPSIDLNSPSNRIVAGIILALVFIGGWWLIARNASFSSDLSDTKAGDNVGATSSDRVQPGSVLGPLSDETPTITASTESIDVQDQGAGMSIQVKKASLVQIGWIAVRDGNGRTLGAGRFEPGVHADVEVPLLRTTEAGQSYQALIYVDDGDKEFDLHKDILVTKDDGSVAGDIFSAL